MDNLSADFTIQNNQQLEAQFEINPAQLNCVFEVRPAGTIWGTIGGTLSNQTDLQNALDAKQDVLTAGDNIQIENNVISATDTTYTAGTGISIEDGVISNTQTSAEWGNIQGTLSNQTDLQNALDAKQNTISDLSTIRTNASNGASAYNTIQTYGDIVTYNATDFATSSQGTLADTALQPGDDITELVNDAGYITGIDSGDVIGALGYTPYDSSNPSGYITSSAIPTNYVTTDTSQSVTGTKDFTQINNVNSNNLATYNSIQLTNDIGNTSENLRLQGNGDRPKYRSGSNVTSFLALQSDVQTYSAGTGIDITSNTVSVTSPTVIDNATGTHSIAIGDSSQSTAEGSVAVGDGSKANSTYSTAIGQNASATNTNTTVIGRSAKATQARAIAIGSGAEANAQDAIAIKGINNTANTFQVYTYNMLDMSTGLIPDARISTNIARSSAIPTVDQIYDGTSANPQSGVAIAGAGFITASSLPIDYYTKSEIDNLIPQPTKVPIVYYQPTDSYCYTETNNRFYGSYVTEKLYLVSPKTSGTDQVIDMSTTFDLSFTIDYKKAPASAVTLAEIMVSYSSGKGVLLQLNSTGLYYRNNITGTTISGTRILTAGNSYDVKVEYDGTHMIISYKLSSEVNYTQANSTTCTCSGSYYNYASIGMDADYGNMALSSVTLTNGGNTLYSYTAGQIALDYDSSLTLNASNQLKVVVDQTFNGTSTNPQSGVAIKNAKFLRNDASYNTDLFINGAGMNSSEYSVALGTSSNPATSSGVCNVVIGDSAYGFGNSVAIGYSASATSNSIQIGHGTNSTASTLQIGFGTSATNYQLLDGTTGLIPDARISTNIARSANIPTVDQTYDSSSANAQSGVAIAGAGFLTSSSLSGYIQNTATGSNAITISGTATAKTQGINIGGGSQVTGNYGVALGCYAYGNGSQALGLGNYARATANYAIQIGKGTNSTASTLQIGFDGTTYQLLDGTTGLIPDARISTNIARSADIPTVPTNISSFNNDSGYITGINSTDVTNALGYTPADNTLSNVSSIDSNSAVQTALDNKVNTADIWYDSTTQTLNIGVAQP